MKESCFPKSFTIKAVYLLAQLPLTKYENGMMIFPIPPTVARTTHPSRYGLQFLVTVFYVQDSANNLPPGFPALYACTIRNKGNKTDRNKTPNKTTPACLGIQS